MNAKRIRSAVAAMGGYTPGEQPREPGVVKLNTNENPYPPSSRIVEVLRNFPVESLRLYPDPTGERLRQRLADIHDCAPENIILGNGSDEILQWCVRAFGERHEPVGWFEPSYSLYPVLAAAEGRPVAPVDLGPEFDWCMPPGYRAALFFLTQPNAPTGRRFERACIEEFCRNFEGIVVLDEAYADFAREADWDLALKWPNVVVTRTLSKSFSLAGLRFGYAIACAEVIRQLMKLKDSYNIDRLTQEVALAALSDLDHMRRNVERVIRTRERVAARLKTMGFEVTPSETNFLWVKPPAGHTARELFEVLRRQNILVRYFPGRRTAEYLRITIGTDTDMDRLLAALERLCSDSAV